MAKHLVVISEDALVYEDLEYWRQLPTLSKVWDKSARVKRVRSVYPTVTYPVHASIVSGVYPDRHGVVNNEKTILGEVSSDWEWDHSAMRVTDLFDAARAAGLTTAAVFWPVTGNHPSIDYLVNEIWPHRPGQTPAQCFEQSGSSPDVMERIVKPNLHLLVPRKHPEADRFVHACACDILRTYKPNLLMVHPANIDAYRHATGLFSPMVKHGLHEADGWLGEIQRALEDAGIAQDTNVFIISDHGQMEITRIVCPNVLLREHGLIDVDENGAVRDYVAMCKSTALSAQVYLKDPSDMEAYARTYDLLQKLCTEEVYGIGRVYTAEEAQREERLSGRFSFVLETDGYTSFHNDWRRPLVRKLDRRDYRFGRATHGHQPDKGPQPPLLAFGPDIVPGVELERRPIVDETATFAALLNVELPGIEGKVIEEILRRPVSKG